MLEKILELDWHVLPALFTFIVLLIYGGRFIKWVKPAIEGNDGKLDNKEFSVFIFMMLYFFMVITTGVFGFTYPDPAWYMTAIGAGLISAVNAFGGKNPLG